MPHARAAEAAGLASMVPHVRVGMSEALGSAGQAQERAQDAGQ